MAYSVAASAIPSAPLPAAVLVLFCTTRIATCVGYGIILINEMESICNANYRGLMEPLWSILTCDSRNCDLFTMSTDLAAELHGLPEKPQDAQLFKKPIQPALLENGIAPFLGFHGDILSES